MLYAVIPVGADLGSGGGLSSQRLDAGTAAARGPQARTTTRAASCGRWTGQTAAGCGVIAGDAV